MPIEISLSSRLLSLLRREGPQTAAKICAALSISQPVFSRSTRNLETELLVIGKARSTRYAARRILPGLETILPIHEIMPDGRARRLGNLHPIHPRGFHFEAVQGRLSSQTYESFPWFLADMEPSGFLGSLIPGRYPDLKLPGSIRNWSEEHHVFYLCRVGANTIGNLILGEEAFRLYLVQQRESGNVIPRSARKRYYPHFAEKALSAGLPGSSAAGEQPKFLTAVQEGKTTAQAQHPVHELLVKFSPPVKDALSQRIADLLHCEHLALQVLIEKGHAAARSRILLAQDRTFLELERFDRVPLSAGGSGRRGLVTLFQLDAEFVGSLGTWPETTEALAGKGILAQADVRKIRFLYLFGSLIGNTDMHHGNLSFYCEGGMPVSLAPVYDMVPALYAPKQNELPVVHFEVPTPSLEDAPYWPEAQEAAALFWSRVAGEAYVSEEMRSIAAENQRRVTEAGVWAWRLPE